MTHPMFFGAALEDCLAVPALLDRAHQQVVKGPFTRKEFAGDHWLILSHAKEVNEELEVWLNKL